MDRVGGDGDTPNECVGIRMRWALNGAAVRCVYAMEGKKGLAAACGQEIIRMFGAGRCDPCSRVEECGYSGGY